jgi:hypothetical protein
MSAPSAPATPGFPLSWGVALAAASLFLVGGGAVIWSSRSDDNSVGPQRTSGEEAAFTQTTARVRPLPLPPLEPAASTGLHTVSYTIENGTRVVKIKVIESGDELVIDATTGRLLEARPSRPTAPPPMGKFAAPFAPMT